MTRAASTVGGRARWPIRILLATVAIALALSQIAVVAAADESTLADGVLTVTVTLPADEGGGPLAEADVFVTVTNGSSVFYNIGGLSAPDGTFTGTVQYETGAGPQVTLDVVVSYFPDIPTSGDCQFVAGYEGSVTGVASGLVVAIAVETVASKREFCPEGGSTLPKGVVADATLVVTVLDEADAPFEGADVTVIATPTDGGDGLAKLGSVSGPDGLATFMDLPRPEDGGPGVTWDVYAQGRRSTTIDGCAMIESWYGSISLAAAAGTSTATIHLTPNVEEVGECEPPPDGSPVLSGWVLAEDGSPIDKIERAAMLQWRPGGGGWLTQLTIGPDGSFETPVHAWGTAETPSEVEIYVQGPVLGEVRDGDCTTVMVLIAHEFLQLDLSAGDLAIPIITAHPTATDTSCEEPTEGGPGGSAPATDVTEAVGSMRPDGGAGTIIAVTTLMALLLVLRFRHTIARR